MQQPKVTEVHRLSPYAVFAQPSPEGRRQAADAAREVPAAQRPDDLRR
jgi:hypothetical protein